MIRGWVTVPLSICKIIKKKLQGKCKNLILSHKCVSPKRSVLFIELHGANYHCFVY